MPLPGGRAGWRSLVPVAVLIGAGSVGGGWVV